MLISGIILTIVMGIALTGCMAAKLSWVERVGLSFPLGMAVETLLMALMDGVGIALLPFNLLIGEAALLIVAILFIWQRRKDFLHSLASVPHIDRQSYNLVWVLFIVGIAYLEYMNLQKCLYYPPFDRDSLAGFETIGYIIAQEHTLGGLSLFDGAYVSNVHDAGSYITYAPFVQLSYGYVYTLGAETSKIVPALMYLFFLIAFYGSVRRMAGKTGAAAATFFMVLTPEMLAFASLSITNVMHAVFASLSVVYMSLWFKERERKDLLLCGSLLGANVWTRTEGVVFIGAVGLLLVIDAVRSRQRTYTIPVALAAVFAMLPLVGWTLFCKLNGLHAESIAIVHPFWDAAKMKTIVGYMLGLYGSTTLYGLTFILFIIAVVGNVWFTMRKKDNLPLLLAIVLASVFYILLLYHIDYKWDAMTNVLSYSAKRFLFCFAPLAWAYTFASYPVRFALAKLERYLL